MPTGERYHDMLEAKGTFFQYLFKPMESPTEEDEDGWRAMAQRDSPLWKQALRFPLQMLKRRKEPGTLILVRHGESLWNANKTFTGWSDPDLSEQGKREVEHAARLLLEGGYEIDCVFTSRLKRAIRSVWIILQEMNQVYLPVFKVRFSFRQWYQSETYVNESKF